MQTRDEPSGMLGGITSSAPRIGLRLRTEIESYAQGSLSIAEICRRIGVTAERLGLARPSYEQVRVHVHQARSLRRNQSMRDVLLDVAFNTAPPTAVIEQLSGARSRRR